MSAHRSVTLARLLQLASPALPVGAYSYSQGLEAAVAAGIVHDASSAAEWIGDMLDLSVARLEAPVLLRLHKAWRGADFEAVARWNELFLASREAAELRAETAQMGFSLRRLVLELGLGDAARRGALAMPEEVGFPTPFAFASAAWCIEPQEALIAYLWAWVENQAMAAMKAVPVGQTDAQRLLALLGERLPDVAEDAAAWRDDELGNVTPGLGLLSSRHETQYSRLFRS